MQDIVVKQLRFGDIYIVTWTMPCVFVMVYARSERPLLFWGRTGRVCNTRRTLCEVWWSVRIWLTASCHISQV